MMNGGLAEVEEAAAPVAYWKKVIAFFAISFLVLFPAFFLLMFGVAQGKPAVKAWFISAMTTVYLEVGSERSRDLSRRPTYFPSLHAFPLTTSRSLARRGASVAERAITRGVRTICHCESPPRDTATISSVGDLARRRSASSSLARSSCSASSRRS